jgi:hypothetical protein
MGMEKRKKKRAPVEGALSRYGVKHPGSSQQHARHLASLRRSRRKNLRPYFFFFLPAFFFILVFSLGLDFVAELLFLLTGIDTSLTLLLPDKHPKLRNSQAGPHRTSPQAGL